MYYMIKTTVKSNNYLSYDSTNQMRGVAIILVILGHLDYITNAGAWGVAIFLILSGFGVTQSYMKNGLSGFFRKRVRSILLPYSFITVIWIAVDYVIYGKTSEIYTLLLAVVGLDFKSTVDPTMWYITFLLMWYIIFYFIFKLKASNSIKLALLYVIGILFLSSAMLGIEIFMKSSGAPLYVLNFPIGVTIGLYYSKILELKNYIVGRVASILGVLSLTCFILLADKWENPLYYMISFNGFAFATIILMSFISYYGIKSKILMFLGNISFYIYLIEGAFVFKYNVFFELPFTKNVQSLIYFIMVVILALCLKSIIEIIMKTGMSLNKSKKISIEQ